MCCAMRAAGQAIAKEETNGTQSEASQTGDQAPYQDRPARQPRHEAAQQPRAGGTKSRASPCHQTLPCGEESLYHLDLLIGGATWPR